MPEEFKEEPKRDDESQKSLEERKKFAQIVEKTGLTLDYLSGNLTGIKSAYKSGGLEMLQQMMKMMPLNLSTYTEKYQNGRDADIIMAADPEKIVSIDELAISINEDLNNLSEENVEGMIEKAEEIERIIKGS